MSRTPTDARPVPMLDVNRQNEPLWPEIAEAIRRVARDGAFVHGPACREFEEAMAAYCGVAHAVGCASGSDALLLALMALDVGPGDEVVIPSFTFFATAGAVWRLGATPVFADIRLETFNVDPADVARKITSRTKAIMPVHLFGQCAEMDALRDAAGDVPLVEDACQAIGAEYRGRRAGALGALGCFSFYPTKNLGGWGDGGLVTTDDGQLAARLRILRDHGQSPRYHHHEVGLNSRLDAIQAAVLSVKLRHLDAWAGRRADHARRYAAQLVRQGLDRQFVPPPTAPGCDSVWNQFTVRVTGGRRDALLAALQARQIGAAIYYPIPLHLQKCFAPLGCRPGSLPASEQAAAEVLSLPVYAELERAEQDLVLAALAEFAAVSVTPQRKAA